MATYQTKYGPIYYDQSGNDHRPNIVDFVPKFPKRHSAVKFQEAAFEAFQEAERRYGRYFAKKNGWVWNRLARAIPVSGTWRSFNYQLDLYRQDPSRYAIPWVSGHVQAVAVDVDTTNPDFEKQREILRGVGWEQVRADEPWHWSWGVNV